MDEKRGPFPPVLVVHGESMALAWEAAYLALAERGLVHDRKDDERDGGKPQLDSSMIIEVRNPDADPFSHRAGGSNAVNQPLLDYYMEMMGSKPGKWWIRNFDDPTDERWEYNYHDSLENWGGNVAQPLFVSRMGLNQMDIVARKLIKHPSTRKAQAITWYPPRDTKASHTPCLQRIWFNIVYGEGEEDHLDIQYDFRSRNVVNASFGNMHAIYMLGCHVREQVEEARGRKLTMRLVDRVNSFHVNSWDYPQYLDYIRNLRSRIAEKPVEDRTLTRAEIIDGLKAYREEVIEATLAQTEKYAKGADLGAERERVNKLCDRIFYLLNKYAPKQNGS